MLHEKHCCCTLLRVVVCYTMLHVAYFFLKNGILGRFSESITSKYLGKQSPGKLDGLKFTHEWRVNMSSVIRQKGEPQTGCFKKTKHAKFSEKWTFLTPWYAHVRKGVSEGNKCSFFGKLGVLCFLETLVLRFALLPYYQQFLVRFL